MTIRIRAFTDGACTGNQNKDKTNTKAGYGIYYEQEFQDKYSLKCVSEQLHSTPTNNRAELMAVLVCLNQISTNEIIKKCFVS